MHSGIVATVVDQDRATTDLWDLVDRPIDDMLTAAGNPVGPAQHPVPEGVLPRRHGCPTVERKNHGVGRRFHGSQEEELTWVHGMRMHQTRREAALDLGDSLGQRDHTSWIARR